MPCETILYLKYCSTFLTFKNLSTLKLQRPLFSGDENNTSKGSAPKLLLSISVLHYDNP